MHPSLARWLPGGGEEDPPADISLRAIQGIRGWLSDGRCQGEALFALAHKSSKGIQVLMPMLPQPSSVGCQAFLQPQVLPVLQAYAVPKPLVGDLVGDHVLIRHNTVRAVDGQRLAFQGARTKWLLCCDDNSIDIEGVRPK